MIPSSPDVIESLQSIQKDICSLDHQYPGDHRLSFLYDCICLATYDEDHIQGAIFLEQSIERHLNSLALEFVFGENNPFL